MRKGLFIIILLHVRLGASLCGAQQYFNVRNPLNSLAGSLTSVTDPQCHPTAVPHSPQVLAASYEVFPNPVSERLFIRHLNSEPGVTFLLSDITGKVLRRFGLAKGSGKEVLDTRAVAPGIYMYYVRSAMGRIASKGKITRAE